MSNLPSRQLSKEQERTVLLLFVAVLFGAIVRLAPTLLGRFPINDGGMFLVMLDSLKSSGWQLPALITYNHLNIPFAYPPLGFYLASVVGEIGNISSIDILRFLPPVISLITIPAYYFIAKALLDSPVQAALATALYALLPRSFGWLIMGGGITRAPGALFFILTIYHAYLLFHKKHTFRIKWVILFGSLVVFTHPESALHTVCACIILWFTAENRWENLRRAFAIALGVIIFSAPWWLNVITQNSFDPFLSALQTGSASPLQSILWVFTNFQDEGFLPVITVLALIGFALMLARKKYLLPLWLVFPFVIEPRSAATFVTIPIALLASTALNDIILPGIAIRTGEPNAWSDGKGNTTRVVLGLLLIYIFVSTMWLSTSLSRNYVVSPLQRESMAWVKNNTSINSRFLIIKEEKLWSNDAIQEWFPALTNRTSMTTLQGLEWRVGKQFSVLSENILQLEHDCLNATAKCVEDWSSRTSTPYDYIYLVKQNSQYPPGLYYSLNNDSNYKLIYDSASTAIYKYLKP